MAFGNGGGVSVLASGKTISIGSGGFGADYLTLKKLKQIGTAAQTLTLTGTAIVNLVGCEFNGNLTLSAGGFLLKDDVFNSASTFTKTGTANCHSDGNNTYNGATSFANNGSSGRLRLVPPKPMCTATMYLLTPPARMCRFVTREITIFTRT
ncbi:MAG: hypothetical protein IPP71_01010 [Bacteroidetes bacterium]|nr:hypothetical protein [Bacteroidota bacterium]